MGNIARIFRTEYNWASLRIKLTIRTWLDADNLKFCFKYLMLGIENNAAYIKY